MALRVYGIVAVSVCVCIAAISCQPGPKEYGASVSGTIYDASTGPVLPKAWIAENDTSLENRVYADSSGNYEWPTWIHHDVTLLIGKDGYQTKTHFFETVSGEITRSEF